MTQSVHHALREQVAATLRAVPALASGVLIAASRRRAVPEQIARAIYVDLEQSPADHQAVIGLTEWHTRFRLEHLARDAGGQGAEALADALLVAAYAALMVPGALGPDVLDVQPKVIAWAEDEADTTLAAAHLVLELHHRTVPTSIAAAA